MDDKLFCFIMCSNDQWYTEECLYYISHLNIPEGYHIDVLTVEGAKSMTSGYNEAMKASPAKYKVYLHQDVFIVNRNFIQDCLDVFTKCPEVGMIGNVGNALMPESGIMWESDRYGKLYETHVYETSVMDIEEETDTDRPYVDVEAIDGLIMITQYDVPWREDLFQKWDFYDASQSMEFIRHGYKVAVPYMKEPWCVHDCGFLSMGNYENERQKFVAEYGDMLRINRQAAKKFGDDMNQEECVSVILPTYNRAPIISRAIQSVLEQTWSNLELIVVDDGSTDNTRQIVEQFTDDRIRYVYLQQNRGPSNARNYGIGLAVGKYIAFQDSDDEWMSDKLAKQMRLMLDSPPEVGLVYCRMERHDRSGAVQLCPPLEKKASQLQGRLFVTLLEQNYIGALTMLVRRECVDKVGGFDEGLKKLEDWEMALRIAESWEIGFIDEMLVKSYATEGSALMDIKSYVETRCYMVAKYWETMAQNNLLNDIIRSVLTTAKRYGLYEEAKQLIAAALQM